MCVGGGGEGWWRRRGRSTNLLRYPTPRNQKWVRGDIDLFRLCRRARHLEVRGVSENSQWICLDRGRQSQRRDGEEREEAEEEEDNDRDDLTGGCALERKARAVVFWGDGKRGAWVGGMREEWGGGGGTIRSC